MNFWTKIVDFIREGLQRIKQKNPKFFRVLQWICLFISAIVTVLMGSLAPEILQIVPKFFNWTFTFPEWLWAGVSLGMYTWSEIFGAILIFCGIVAAVAQLPNKDKP